MYRVLIIEDDTEISEVLKFYLTKEGHYEVTTTRSAEAAFPLLKRTPFDAILLDIMLPGMDGIQFCGQIRSLLYCPIIFISCLDDDETIIRAMNMGGDDYLVKPFNCAVLQAYVAANIRRSKMAHPESHCLIIGDLVLDTVSHRVNKHGQEIILSPTEYELLYFLMQREGIFIPFEELYRAVWDSDSCGDLRTLFTHVGNLRKKIEDDPKAPTYLTTHRRSGYIFYPYHLG